MSGKVEYEIDKIDNVINTLVKLRGMFGAVKYLMNPNGERIGGYCEDFESWFSDIEDKLDETVNLLSA